MDGLVYAKGILDTESGTMEDTGLLFKNGRIAGRGDFHQLRSCCPEMMVFDYRNEYLLPGLINTHVHLEFQPCLSTYQTYVDETEEDHILAAQKAVRQLLFSGVTALRDAGSSYEMVRWFHRQSAAPRPRLFLAGPPITARGGHLNFLGGEADTKEELEGEVAKRKDAGCDFIKIIVSGGQLTPGSRPEADTYEEWQIRRIVETAKQEKMKTAAHCLTMDSMVHAMEAGVDSIEHCACFQRNKINGCLERVYQPERMEQFRGDPRFFMPGLSNQFHQLDRARSCPKKADPREVFLLDQEKKAYQIVRNLMDLGMRPTIGTDGGCGLTYFNETWLELKILVENCNVSCLDAIRSATCLGAEALGAGDFLGRLKPGYAADFITMPMNPLEHIEALADVRHVVLDGKIVK